MINAKCKIIDNKMSMIREIQCVLYGHVFSVVAASYRQTRTQVGWLGLRVGGHPVLSLHSPDEQGELSQW